MDLYRLGNASDVRGAGLEEHLLRPDGITVVEWIERWDEPLPGLRRIRFRWIDEGTREVTYDDLPCT
jgi:tRNA A37 threonylcarbamoyladenosine biosynthesis protein TsaE